MKGGEFLNQLGDYQLLMKDCVPGSQRTKCIGFGIYKKQY